MNRYGLIVKRDDGQEEVAITSLSETRPRDPDRFRGNPDIDRGKVEQVEFGVTVGMVRGGKFGSVGGFGWEDEEAFRRKG